MLPRSARRCLNSSANLCAARLSGRHCPRCLGGMRMGKKDRDEWIVKCPKCGRIRESCRHVSRDDVRRIIRLLDAGVEVYQAEDEREPAESHVHAPPRPVAQGVAPRFSLGDLVLAEPSRVGWREALTELRPK